MSFWSKFRRREVKTPELITSLEIAPPPEPAPEVVIPTTTVTLLRDAVSAIAVQGTLVAKGETFHCIERPWLDNRRNESCIPAGTYEVTFLPRSASGKYKNVWHVHDVPGRSGVLIHKGNLVEHSRGCLIIGKRRGWITRKPAVLNSGTALGEFNDLMRGETFTLKIIGDQTC